MTVEYHELPGLGEKVSRVGAGCWTIGGPATNNGVAIGWDGVEEVAAYEGLERACAAGVTLYDTADVYGMGQSERLVGRLLRQVERDGVVVSSKVGYLAGSAAHPYLPRQMLHQFNTTLDNLGTSYVDVYHLHSTDFGPDDRYLGSAVATMERLRDQGRVRAVGMRAPHRFAVEWADQPGHPYWAQARRFLRLVEAIRPDVLTVRYNLMTPLYGSGETDVLAFARARGIGVLVKQVLGQGLLLGAGHEGRRTVGDHRSRKPVDPGLARCVNAAVGALKAEFGPSRSDLARVALRYVLGGAPEATVLVGFRDARQLGEVLARADEPLSASEVERVKGIMSPVREALASSPVKTRTSCEN